jgi:hypothetical protein
MIRIGLAGHGVCAQALTKVLLVTTVVAAKAAVCKKERRSENGFMVMRWIGLCCRFEDAVQSRCGLCPMALGFEPMP